MTCGDTHLSLKAHKGLIVSYLIPVQIQIITNATFRHMWFLENLLNSWFNLTKLTGFVRNEPRRVAKAQSSCNSWPELTEVSVCLFCLGSGSFRRQMTPGSLFGLQPSDVLNSLRSFVTQTPPAALPSSTLCSLRAGWGRVEEWNHTYSIVGRDSAPSMWRPNTVLFMSQQGASFVFFH